MTANPTHPVQKAPGPSSPPGARQAALFDAEDPRALVNKVPRALREAMERTLADYGSLFDQDEQQFRRTLRENGRHLTATDNRIRINFWLEYDRSVAEQRELNISTVVAGACARDYFYKSYVKDPYRVAWLLCPPASYQVIADEALTFGMEQLRDILGMDNYEKKNGLDVLNMNLLKLKVKIVEMLDLRKNGGAVNRNLNLNATVGSSAAHVTRAAEEFSMEALDKELAQLQERGNRAVNAPKVVDAEVVS